VKELLTVPMSDNFEFQCEETNTERDAVAVLAELRSQLNTWTFSTKSRAMLDLLLGGVSQRAAAEEYGVSLRTIRAWQHTALIELRERMQYAA
jgi:DNA-directed RNA polymerase specialized sigma24 family protein